MKLKKSYQDSGYWIAKVKKDGSLVARQMRPSCVDASISGGTRKNADEALVEIRQIHPESKFVLVRMVLEPVKEPGWMEDYR